jgi:hypothetical protein
MPQYGKESDAYAPVEPCELPDDLQLVYIDDRDRRRTIALKDAVEHDFGMAGGIPQAACVPRPAQLPRLVVVGYHTVACPV